MKTGARLDYRTQGVCAGGVHLRRRAHEQTAAAIYTFSFQLQIGVSALNKWEVSYRIRSLDARLPYIRREFFGAIMPR